MFKRYGYICAFLLILLNPALSFADINRTDNLKSLKLELEKLNKDDLVIFDIDDVVIQPVDQIFHPHNKKQLSKYYSDIQAQVSPEHMNDLLSIVNIQQQVRLVDTDINEIFTYLRKHSIPTIALTHCGTGKFGKIKDVADWRIAQLDKVGINFRDLSPYHNYTYDSLKGKHGTAMFKSGILFTGFIDKGQVLVKFLQTNKITPRRIIFIDDRKINLSNVATSIQEHAIIFSGFEYVAVSEQQTAELNTKMTDMQFYVLQDEGKWLSDSLAQERMSDLR